MCNLTDSEILNELVHSGARCKLIASGAKRSLDLEEPGVCKCAVTNVPIDAIVIKVDKFAAPTSVFCGNKGECRRADFAIISESHKCIILVEIKNGRDSNPNIVQQLTGAMCFIDYLRAVGINFWEEKEFLKSYNLRFVCISQVGMIRKRKTKIEYSTVKHDKPYRFLKISCPHHLQFGQLAKVN